MKCPKCGGTGWVTGRDWNMYLCATCDGEGSVPPYEPMTNEEWFDGLSTKEKAKALAIICIKERNNDGDSMSGWYEKHDEKYWEMWLKQPHTEKE